MAQKKKERYSQNLSRTDPLKRRLNQPSRFCDELEGSSSEEEDFYYLVCFDNTQEYSIVDSDKIVVESDGTTYKLRHRGKFHKATILKKGKSTAITSL